MSCVCTLIKTLALTIIILPACNNLLQLKTHIQGQNIFPSVDNTYSAKAVNNAVLDQILQTKSRQITAIVITLQCLLIVFILGAVIIVIAVHGYGGSHKWFKMLQKFPTANVYFRKKQASILAIVIVSYVIISYIIALDIAALARRDRPFNQLVFDIHNKRPSELHHPFRLLYEIPGIVFAFDLFGALFSLGMTLMSIIFHVCPYTQCSVSIFQRCAHYHRCCCQNCLRLILFIISNPFIFLCLSSLGFICCIVTHVPFVAIAYLNDAFHAGSIFVYYVIIILVLFAVVEKLIVSCQKKFSFDQPTISLKNSTWSLKEGYLHCISEQDKTTRLNLHCGKESNFLEVNSGQIKVDFKKVDSKIILGIEKGELSFVNSKIASEYLVKVKQSQDPKVLILDEKILPTVRVTLKGPEHEANVQHQTKVFTFSGLKPIHGQGLNVHKVNDIDTDRKQPIKVNLGRTTLTLQRVGQLQDRCLGCSCGWITTLFAAAVMVSLLSIAAILTSYFVIIPINRSISDAPNRLIGIYESAIVLVGAYIAYKAFFKAKKYLESSVVKRENSLTQESKDQWKEMSDEEKLAEFYSAVVDIIVDKKSKCQPKENKHCQTEDGIR